jgi:hypothetical protein
LAAAEHLVAGELIATSSCSGASDAADFLLSPPDFLLSPLAPSGGPKRREAVRGICQMICQTSTDRRGTMKSLWKEHCKKNCNPGFNDGRDVKWRWGSAVEIGWATSQHNIMICS